MQLPDDEKRRERGGENYGPERKREGEHDFQEHFARIIFFPSPSSSSAPQPSSSESNLVSPENRISAVSDFSFPRLRKKTASYFFPSVLGVTEFQRRVSLSFPHKCLCRWRKFSPPLAPETPCVASTQGRKMPFSPHERSRL